MRRLVTVALLTAAAPATLAGLFSAPQPELIYTGAGASLTEGVIVIRDPQAFQTAVEALDPPYGGPAPNLKKLTVLRVVGRARENRCQDTALIEVSTENKKATVKLEERTNQPDCPCAPDPRPPKVYLVTVTHWVRSASVEVSDVVAPCEVVAKEEKVVINPTLIYEGSWDFEAGVKVIIDEPDYRKVLTTLGLPDRGPEVDFNKDRVIAVTGRPRENGCRRTRVIDARLTSPEEAFFEVEEVYAATGQMCAQVFMKPMVFLYRVPSTVMSARSITQEVR